MLIWRIMVWIGLLFLAAGCSDGPKDLEDPHAAEARIYSSKYPFPMWNDSGGQKVTVYVGLLNSDMNSKRLKGVVFHRDQIGINANQIIWIDGWINIKEHPDTPITMGQTDTQEVNVQVKDLIWKISDGSWNAYSIK